MIYFLRDKNTSCIKIGYSKDMCVRLSQLQIGNPGEIELVGICFTGNKKDETLLHQSFAEFHVRGEWFNEESWPFIVGVMEEVNLQYKKIHTATWFSTDKNDLDNCLDTENKKTKDVESFGRISAVSDGPFSHSFEKIESVLSELRTDQHKDESAREKVLGDVLDFNRRMKARTVLQAAVQPWRLSLYKNVHYGTKKRNKKTRKR